MDLPTFLIVVFKEQVALVAAVAWPVSIVAVALIFRREVRGLLGRVSSFNWRSGELTLRSAVHQVSEAVNRAVEEKNLEPEAADVKPPDRRPSSGAAPSKIEVEERYLHPALKDPAIHLTFGWSTVMNELGKLFKLKFPDLSTENKVSEQARLLVACGAISQSESMAIVKMRDLVTNVLIYPGLEHARKEIDEIDRNLVELTRLLQDRIALSRLVDEGRVDQSPAS